MRIFCKGFNLYNQLNQNGKCIVEFQPTVLTKSINCFEINHSFSVFSVNNTIHFNCNLLENGTVELKCENNIAQIAAKDTVILILNHVGQLYKILLENIKVIQPVPKFVEGNDKIKLISASATLSIAYTESGMLYSIPTKLDFENRNVIDIKTGREHCVMLDMLGNVYTFGVGSRGQLGHGSLDDELSPKLMEALAGIKVLKISAGGWHSAAISSEGDLYMWGLNQNGQLGMGEKEKVTVMAIPTVIDIGSCTDIKVTAVACGSKHTIILLDNNSLYGCGWNGYKQVRNEDQEEYFSFMFMYDFSTEEIEKIICGPWNSVVLCK